MSQLLLTVLTLTALLVQPSELLANAVAILKDGRNVLVATAWGELQSWQSGIEKPRWSIKLRDRRSKSYRGIALIQDLGNGRVLVVEHGGQIFTFDAGRMPPAGNDWKRQVATIEGVAAAAMDHDEILLLASSEKSVVYQIDPRTFRQQGDKQLPFAPIHKMRLFVWDRSGHSALAVCEKTILVGSEGGTLYIFQKDHATRDSKMDGRFRDLVEDEKSARRVLKAGCLTSDLGYTVYNGPISNVHSDSTFSQVQLWDLKKAVLIDNVDMEMDEELPLYTFNAIPSSDGDRLIALGEDLLRVWSVKNRRLELIGKQRINNSQDTHAATPLPNGQFILYDGVTLWTVSADGKSKEYFAGRRP